jgi:2-polyprenyl-3-methyl-5-hydroxy-6-metoxy-1,4-benzoquinol methylase
MKVSPELKASLLHCVVCSADVSAADVATTQIRSNVRRFASEVFRLWQCPSCKSIHAVDEVDLASYYAHYPFHGQRPSFPVRLAYNGKLRELEKFGLQRQQRILDYGCGGGVFVEHLRSHGYQHASGYDAYVKEGEYAVEPTGLYDVVLSQDVIEHVDSPRAHLERLIELTVPGGLIVLGTPNAGVVEMAHPERYIHILHQPYHRHVLSAAALESLAKSLGVELLAVRHGFVGNRAIPGLNGRYLLRTLRAHGDVLDDMVAGKVVWKWELFSPGAFWDLFTGYWNDPGNDMTVVLRAPGIPEGSRPQS